MHDRLIGSFLKLIMNISSRASAAKNDPLRVAEKFEMVSRELILKPHCVTVTYPVRGYEA